MKDVLVMVVFASSPTVDRVEATEVVAPGRCPAEIRS
jgi:hypothetical protein